MPIYEYLCKKCNISIERLQRMNDPSPTCALCAKKMQRIVSPTNFVLKGGGWYKDSYETPTS